MLPALDPSSSSPAPPQPHLLGQLILLEGLKAATSPLQERPLTSAIFVNLFLLLRDSYLNFAVAQTQPKERKGGLGFYLSIVHHGGRTQLVTLGLREWHCLLTSFFFFHKRDPSPPNGAATLRVGLYISVNPI